MEAFRRQVLGSATLAVVAAGLTLGAFSGLGVFTFWYARGGSYLTSDPAACANCHAMHEQYESWMKGSHRAVAVCNDCHTPGGALKYYGKLRNGIFHSWAFTTGYYPDQIQITGYNRRVAEESCRKCHADLVHGIESTREPGQAVSCIQCHARVGHQ